MIPNSTDRIILFSIHRIAPTKVQLLFEIHYHINMVFILLCECSMPIHAFSASNFLVLKKNNVSIITAVIPHDTG